jgi:hypothetical protein
MILIFLLVLHLPGSATDITISDSNMAEQAFGGVVPDINVTDNYR